MSDILGAAGRVGLALVSSPALWYCMTAIVCASLISNDLREGLARAARYQATVAVLSGLHSPAELRRTRKRLGARVAYGGIADGRHVLRFGLTEREMERLDRAIADGHFPEA